MSAGVRGAWQPARWGASSVLRARHFLSTFLVPQFEFTGEYLKLDPRPACKAEEVQGAGFSPWSYPAMHALLGKETTRT